MKRSREFQTLRRVAQVRHRLRVPEVAGVLAVASIAVLLGLVPGLLPLKGTLAVAALLLLVASVALVSRALRTPAQIGRAPATTSLPRSQTGGRSDSRGRIGLDTALFFIGAATVVEVSWRVGRLTFSDICFLGSFAWCCFVVSRSRRPIERLPVLLVVGVFLFVVGGVASSIGSSGTGRSLYEVGRAIWVLLLWPWTAAMVLRDRRALVIALALWGIAGTVDALGALGQVTGASTLAGPTVSNRATGFGSHPNDLGAAAATLLVPVVALAVKFRARLPVVNVLQWGVVGLVLASLVLSGSVSGMAGAFVGFTLWTISPAVRGTTRVVVIAALAGALLLSSGVGSTTSSPLHRVQQVFAAPGSSPDAGSASAHLQTIEQAWPRIRSDPVIGIGLDNSALIVHSGLVAAWLGGGIFALVGMLLVLGGALSFGWWAAVTAPDDVDRSITWALVCAVIAFLVFFVNQPLFFNQYGFIALALLVASGCRVARAKSEASDVVRMPSRALVRLGARSNQPIAERTPAGVA